MSLAAAMTAGPLNSQMATSPLSFCHSISERPPPLGPGFRSVARRTRSHDALDGIYPAPDQARGVQVDLKADRIGCATRLRSAWIETLLAEHPSSGRFCHGESPTIADICLVTQVTLAKTFNLPFADTAALMHVRISAP